MIRADLEQAGFSGIEIETRADVSWSPSPRHLATAFCQGTPIRGEIEEGQLRYTSTTFFSQVAAQRLAPEVNGERLCRKGCQTQIVGRRETLCLLEGNRIEGFDAEPFADLSRLDKMVAQCSWSYGTPWPIGDMQAHPERFD